MLTIIKGDLLKFNFQYIAHQTNCIPGVMGGLAGQIVKKYPYADTRNGICQPGKIDVFSPVINMYGQDSPGFPNRTETSHQRLMWFKMCLRKIVRIPELKNIAFPYQIGCGLAGGDWLEYESVLLEFADYIYNIKKTKVYLVKL